MLLTYRLPREPSTPRSAVWRKLRKLGVAQISDGLVALPVGGRTREQLEWVAEEVTDAGGTAAIWIARPTTRSYEDQLIAAMAAARAAEYRALTAAAASAAASPSDSTARGGVLRRLRNELRAIQRRDYFPPDDRDRAETAVQAMADASARQPAPPAGGRQAAAGSAGPARRPGREAP